MLVIHCCTNCFIYFKCGNSPDKFSLLWINCFCFSTSPRTRGEWGQTVSKYARKLCPCPGFCACTWLLFFLPLIKQTKAKLYYSVHCKSGLSYSKVFLCAFLQDERGTKHLVNKIKEEWWRSHREYDSFCHLFHYSSPMSNVRERLLVWSPIMETRRKVQLEPCSSHYHCSEGGNLSLNKYCPAIFKNLNNCWAGVKPEVHCDGKVHRHGSPTQAPENRSARFRDLDPEQRGVHYPHSTTTERLVSILHPLPAMRLAVKRGAVKSFQCVSLVLKCCASLRFSTEPLCAVVWAIHW